MAATFPFNSCGSSKSVFSFSQDYTESCENFLPHMTVCDFPPMLHNLQFSFYQPTKTYVQTIYGGFFVVYKDNGKAFYALHD